MNLRQLSTSKEWPNILDRLMINIKNNIPEGYQKAEEECIEKHIDPVLIKQVIQHLAFPTPHVGYDKKHVQILIIKISQS